MGPKDLRPFCDNVRNIYYALRPRFSRTPTEQTSRVWAEKSLAFVREVSAGKKISEQDLFLIRPGTGIQWADRNKVICRWTQRDFKRGELVTLKETSE